VVLKFNLILYFALTLLISKTHVAGVVVAGVVVAGVVDVVVELITREMFYKLPFPIGRSCYLAVVVVVVAGVVDVDVVVSLGDADVVKGSKVLVVGASVIFSGDSFSVEAAEIINFNFITNRWLRVM
jgi:hypothetical protein